MESKLEILKRAGTAIIADAFDKFGYKPLVLDNALYPIGKDSDGRVPRFAGPAYTIAGKSRVSESAGDRKKLRAIDEMPAGAVAVWAGNDIRGVCCFGDLLATAMQARGCAAVIVDGGVRDVEILRQLHLPIVTRYQTPAQAIGRWIVTASQEPVTVRGALEDQMTINPGDIVVGDEDGIVVVPTARLDELLPEVMKAQESESEARQDIAQGMPLLEALARYGHL